MKKTLLARAMGLLLSAAAALCAVPAEAQSDDYFDDSWWNCELSGTETKWVIKQYKESMSWTSPLVYETGHIIFSETCIEISCNAFQMHFPVGQYKRISENIFCVTRGDEDEYFDYIECVRGGGQQGYRFMMSKQDPDGTMQNTRLFVCKPQVISTGATRTEAFRSQGQSVGFPPQVPKK